MESTANSSTFTPTLQGYKQGTFRTLICPSCNVRNEVVFEEDKSYGTFLCWSCKTSSVLTPDELKRTKPYFGAHQNDSSQASNSNANSQSQQSQSQTTVTIVEEEFDYYEVLGLTKETATDAEIKKSYYKLARQYHPDKNPNDPVANTMFLKISEAYQVLSDEGLRERYHKYGRKGVKPESGLMNARDFFNQVFGGGKFEQFIGEFMTGSVDNENLTEQERKERQNKREETLTRNLIERLDKYVKGIVSDKEFEKSAKEDVEELKDLQFGKELLFLIGYVYEQEASKKLGGFFGFAASIAGKAHIVKETFGAISAAYQIQSMQNQLQNMNEDQQKEAVDDKMAQQGINAFFKLGKLEIEITLRHVCESVLLDTTVDNHTLKKRAEGMKIIGKTFKNVPLK